MRNRITAAAATSNVFGAALKLKTPYLRTGLAPGSNGNPCSREDFPRSKNGPDRCQPYGPFESHSKN
jgi:hypothetical protein